MSVSESLLLWSDSHNSQSEAALDIESASALSRKLQA
jgi:hypothetical protein